MWELDHEESWALKYWWFWTVVLDKTLESPLNCKEIQPVHPKGDQSWIFIGRTDAEAEALILWPLDVKNWFIGKDPDAGKDWMCEDKGMTEDERVGWHHRLNGHEFEQAPGVGDGQGSLVCCSPWGRKESDMTEKLNWTDISITEKKKWLYIVAHLSWKLTEEKRWCYPSFTRNWYLTGHNFSIMSLFYNHLLKKNPRAHWGGLKLPYHFFSTAEIISF